MKYLLIVYLVAFSCKLAAAEVPAVELLDGRGRNRIVSIASGKVVMSVPPEWSIVTSSFTSMQNDFESLDPTVRNQWRPGLRSGNVLRIERLLARSDEHPPRSELTLTVHADSTAETAATSSYRGFSETFGMDILISPKIELKTINAEKMYFFRLASTHTVEEHNFLQVGDDVYHFTASEATHLRLPSKEVDTLVGRIEVHPEASDQSSDD